MHVLRSFDGSVYAERLELDDMPPCRACGCAPVARRVPNGMQLQCPECGMNTGMSINEQRNYKKWEAAMGPAKGPGGESRGR